LFPPDDERLSLETCRGGKINTLKKEKKCVKLVENPQFPQDARSTEYKIHREGFPRGRQQNYIRKFAMKPFLFVSEAVKS
jgi:hypothetical protein